MSCSEFPRVKFDAFVETTVASLQQPTMPAATSLHEAFHHELNKLYSCHGEISVSVHVNNAGFKTCKEKSAFQMIMMKEMHSRQPLDLLTILTFNTGYSLVNGSSRNLQNKPTADSASLTQLHIFASSRCFSEKEIVLFFIQHMK